MRLTIAAWVLLALAQASVSAVRPRARELGIAPGVMQPGPLNAITDVTGVLVGQTTIVEVQRSRRRDRNRAAPRQHLP